VQPVRVCPTRETHRDDTTRPVDVAILSCGSVLPQIKGGKPRPVAVASGRRSPVLSDTPTI
jgi:tripartite-type tricarboxylate transporter receptor subunit TctC